MSTAVLEGRDTLVDWGAVTVRGRKNPKSLLKVSALMAMYRPDVLVLENTHGKGSRRAPRIAELVWQIRKLGIRDRAKIQRYARDEIRQCFAPRGAVTK